MNKKNDIAGEVARLASEAELSTLLRSAPAAVIYFSSHDCGICHVLKPRITALLAEQFPNIVFAEVDCTAAPGLAALHQVFSVPVVVLFLEGRESLRWVRNFHLDELREQMMRPYSLLFGGAS